MSHLPFDPNADIPRRATGGKRRLRPPFVAVFSPAYRSTESTVMERARRVAGRLRLGAAAALYPELGRPGGP